MDARTQRVTRHRLLFDTNRNSNMKGDIVKSCMSTIRYQLCAGHCKKSTDF